MDIRIRQRLVGGLVLLSLVFLIIPVVLDGDGRIPEKITQIPPKPKRPDLSHIRVVEPAQDQLVPLPSEPPADPESLPVQQAVPTEPAQSEATAAESEQAARDAGNAWSVQVGSFRESARAAELRDKLRAAGFSAYLKEVLLTDGTLFTQVLVGPEPELELAHSRKDEIQASIGQQGLVVRYQP